MELAAPVLYRNGYSKNDTSEVLENHSGAPKSTKHSA